MQFSYTNDDFNTKVKVVVLQQRQNWEAPQIKELKLIIPEHYTFMASNSFFIVLGILEYYLESTTRNKSTLTRRTYKTALDTSTLSKLLSLHCKQINRVKNDLDGQPSRLLACMQVSDYKAAFTTMHFVFLELGTHHCHLDFKLLDENKNVIIPRTFCLQLLTH